MNLKKILIVDSKRPPPNAPDFSKYGFVEHVTGYPKAARQKPEVFAAAIIYSTKSTEWSWARDNQLLPLFVFSSDVVAAKEKNRVVYLPRDLFYERAEIFLRHYERTGQVDPAFFSDSPPEEAPLMHLRLRQLQVRGLKASRDSGQVLLPNPCVIVGRNGSGKSSLLEALQWQQEATWQGLQEATQQRFRSFTDLLTRGCSELRIDLSFDACGETPELTYSLAVRANGQGRPVVVFEECRAGEKVEIETVQEGGVAVRQIHGGNPVRDEDTLALSQAPTGSGARRVLAFLRHAVFLRLSPRSLAQVGSLQAKARGPLLDEYGLGLPALLEGLGESGLADLLTRLRRSLDPALKIGAVSLFRYPDQTGVLGLDQQLPTGTGIESQRLPAWVLSEGTRRIVGMFALLAAAHRPSLLAIEEVENGLDPWTLDSLLVELNKLARDGIPVLLTTHSPYFLNRFETQSLLVAEYRDGGAVYQRADKYPRAKDYEGDIPPGVLYLNEYFKE